MAIYKYKCSACNHITKHAFNKEEFVHPWIGCEVCLSRAVLLSSVKAKTRKPRLGRIPIPRPGNVHKSPKEYSRKIKHKLNDEQRFKEK